LTNKSNHSRINESVKFITFVIAGLIFFRLILHYLEIEVLEVIVFYFIPKWFLFILPTCFLIYRYVKKIPLKRSIFDYFITTVGFVIIYFYLTPHYFQKLDWNINYKKRIKIVALAKNKRLKKLSESIYSFPDSLTLFPFLRPNQVFVQTLRDTFVTVNFYTGGGSLDHYPRFVYSNDKIDLQKLDNIVNNDGTNSKLEANWYLIHD